MKVWVVRLDGKKQYASPRWYEAYCRYLKIKKAHVYDWYHRVKMEEEEADEDIRSGVQAQ